MNRRSFLKIAATAPIVGLAAKEAKAQPAPVRERPVSFADVSSDGDGWKADACSDPTTCGYSCVSCYYRQMANYYHVDISTVVEARLSKTALEAIKPR